MNNLGYLSGTVQPGLTIYEPKRAVSFLTIPNVSRDKIWIHSSSHSSESHSN